MKKALIYAGIASIATLGFVMFFVIITSFIPPISSRINYDSLGSVLAYIMAFGIIPAACVLGFEQQLRDEERQRRLPVHERENLRPLHLEHLPDTLKAISASRR